MKGKGGTVKVTYMYDPECDIIRTFTGGVRKMFVNVRLREEDYFLDLFGAGTLRFSDLDKSNYEVPDTFVEAFGYNYIYGVL